MIPLSDFFSRHCLCALLLGASALPWTVRASHVLIDDFNDSEDDRNSLGWPATAVGVQVESSTHSFDGSRALKLVALAGGSYATYLAPNGQGLDTAPHPYLGFAIKGGVGGEHFVLQFQQVGEPSVLEVDRVVPVAEGWQYVGIPLVSVPQLDPSGLQAVRFFFQEPAVLHIDGLAFTDTPPAAPRRTFAYAWSGESNTYENMYKTYRLRRSNVDDVSAAVDATARMPEGYRAIFSWDVHGDMHQHPLDKVVDPQTGALTAFSGVWWEHGVQRVKARFESFFEEYVRQGGVLDMFVLDYEVGMSNWGLGGDSNRYEAIENDPRYPAIRFELEASGFPSNASIHTVRQYRSGDHYLIWNEVMGRRKAAYINEAIYSVVTQHFPHARMSNYGHVYHSTDYPVHDYNGHRDYAYGAGSHVGTHQAFAFYGGLGQLMYEKLDGERYYWRRRFNAMRYALNKGRSMYLSSDIPFLAWVSHINYSGSIFRNTDYYQELVFHLLAGGADDLLLWNSYRWRTGQDPAVHGNPETDALLRSCMEGV